LFSLIIYSLIKGCIEVTGIHPAYVIIKSIN